MIKRLSIRNLAIIRELDVFFGPQLNMITGETGAGKSVLIGAVSLLLGGRAGHDLVRSGADMAVIEGEFINKDATWVVRRLIKPGGASRAFVDEEPIKLADLAAKAESWVDLHGQHEHQSILRVPTHLEFLDAYAGLMQQREVLANLYRSLIETRLRREQLSSDAERFRQDKELQEFQLSELVEADLKPGEEELLAAELKLLSQAGNLSVVLEEINRHLESNERSIAGELGHLTRQLDPFTDLDADLANMRKRLDAVRVEVGDLGFESKRYQSTVRIDPERQQEVEERMATLETVKRKYGGTLDQAMLKREELEASVDLAVNSDEELSRLKGEVDRLTIDYSQQCVSLSDARQEATDTLAREIVSTLSALDMPAVKFEVRMSRKTADGGLCVIDGDHFKSDERGCDQVEYYMSANEGEVLRPLAKTASGGEISRTMLGIKSVLAEYDPVGCLIFDEIDSGISGSTAYRVGSAIEALSRERQVICISHLPQIASQGERHFRVSKSQVDGRTESAISELSKQERRQEIARLLSGPEITPASLEQADLLLQGAQPLVDAEGS
ncbi:MAG: DNA repair protein RecN [Candidatus Marinimicrobia bacterium]|nr:DNA repair protein RecN [Candidatus Neomarinimicrobiota bacterium]